MAPDPDYVGTLAAQLAYTNASATLLVAGIQCFMALYGLSVFLETPQERRAGRAPYITISFLIFALFTLTAALDSFHIFKLTFGAASGEDIIVKIKREAGSWDRILSLGSMMGHITLCEGLLFYRLYIIWRHRWWVSVVPALLYFSLLGMGIFRVVPSADGMDHLASAWTLLTVAFNLSATVLISSRLIIMRRRLTKLMGIKTVSPYTKVVTILVESALPLSFFGIAYAISLAFTTQHAKSNESWAARKTAQSTFAFFYTSFAALSPQMIIFRVTIGRSWMGGQTNVQTVSNASGPHALEFAHPTIEHSLMSFSGRDMNDGEHSVGMVDSQRGRDVA